MAKSREDRRANELVRLAERYLRMKEGPDLEHVRVAIMAGLRRRELLEGAMQCMKLAEKMLGELGEEPGRRARGRRDDLPRTETEDVFVTLADAHRQLARVLAAVAAELALVQRHRTAA